jgi:signal transduction histidine kinase/ActR/RegA family two-component response regulator
MAQVSFPITPQQVRPTPTPTPTSPPPRPPGSATVAAGADASAADAAAFAAPPPALHPTLYPLAPRARSRHTLVRYAATLVITAGICVAARHWMPEIWRYAPLAPVMVIVIAASYFAGPGPAVAAMFLGAGLVDWFYFTHGTFIIGNTPEENLRLGVFLLLGSLVNLASARWQRSNDILRDREQKLRILLEKMPVVLWSTDLELRLTNSSDALAYLFSLEGGDSDGDDGPRPGLTVDPNLFHRLAADSIPVDAQRRAAMGGEAVSYEWAQGQRQFHVHVEPLRNDKGIISGTLGMAWDITAQHLAEQMVRQANQQLEARVARRTEELARANQVLMQQIAERKRVEGQRDAERDQALAERSARAEAEAANRAKDQFLAMLSHELRTPMAPVLMTVSHLENDPLLSEELRSALRMIRRNVELEARLIDDLLDLTRVSRGKVDLSPRDTDIHSLLCHARDVCRADAEAKHVSFEMRMVAPRCYVYGDPIRLEQVLWNLVRNAVKFTPEGGTITLRTANDATGRLIVQVIDSGVGIAPEMLSRIFDAFEQGGPTVTRRFGGLGLGLAISKALIDLHHGSIAAHSEGLGHGATFTVTLNTIDTPAIGEPKTGEAPPTARAAAEAGGIEEGSAAAPPLRILLVEDHPDTRKATARLLRLFGHDVATADSVASGLQAMEKWPEHGEENRGGGDGGGSSPFDLIISDLGLPDGSGLDLVRQLKRRYGSGGPKAIALTGFGMDADLRTSRDCGFEAHLVKPVPIEQLEAAVRQVAGR